MNSVAATPAATRAPSRWFARRSQRGAIGIDFGMERVNLVQVGRVGAQHVIHAATARDYGGEREALLDAPAELKQILRAALRERPFRGSKAVVSVPPTLVEMLVINYRCASDESEEHAIARATEERIGSSIASRVVDYLPISGAHDGARRAALVAVADHGAIVKFLETLRYCGLDVTALEVGPIAIQRLVSAIDNSATPTIVAITFGTVRSYLTVMSRGELLLDRAVDFGTNRVAEKLQAALACTTSEAHQLLQTHGFTIDGPTDSRAAIDPMAKSITDILKPEFLGLAKDIAKTRDYAEAETRCEISGPLYAFGSLARWPNADRVLSAACGIEISSINPFYGLEIATNAADMANIGPICGIAVATGLALREFG